MNKWNSWQKYNLPKTMQAKDNNGHYIFCQSCGMPKTLKGGIKMNATEANGKESFLYCKNCFKEGKFTQPAITLREMADWSKKTIIATKGIKTSYKFHIMRNGCTRRVHSLKRWENTDKSEDTCSIVYKE